MGIPQFLHNPFGGGHIATSRGTVDDNTGVVLIRGPVRDVVPVQLDGPIHTFLARKFLKLS